MRIIVRSLLPLGEGTVLDPFMGSGSTLVAAAQLSRRYVGYDLDPTFVELARTRVAEEGEPVASKNDEGHSLSSLCEDALLAAGFTISAKDKRISKTGLSVDFLVTDLNGEPWYIEMGGHATAHRSGLSRQETVLRLLGRASALRGRLGSDARIVVLCAALPEPRSESDTVLRAAGPNQIFDVIDVFDPDGHARLKGYAQNNSRLPGFWSPSELGS